MADSVLWKALLFYEAIEAKCPVVLDVQIDCDDKVFPMVAPGGAIEEAFSQEDLDAKKE